MAVAGAVVVNAIWWVCVMIAGLAFPFMHYVLAFFLITYLGIVDNRVYPGEVSPRIYSVLDISKKNTLITCINTHVFCIAAFCK